MWHKESYTIQPEQCALNQMSNCIIMVTKCKLMMNVRSFVHTVKIIQPYSYSQHSNNICSEAFDNQMAISTQWKLYIHRCILYNTASCELSVQYVLALLDIILLSYKSTEYNVCALCGATQLCQPFECTCKMTLQYFFSSFCSFNSI